VGGDRRAAAGPGSAAVSDRAAAGAARGDDAPPRALVLVVAAWLALLVLAPPASNLLWAFDGLRSVAPPVALALLAGAFAATALVTRTRVPGAALAVALAAALAFPLRERFHLIGDSDLRLRAIDAMTVAGASGTNLGGIGTLMHAQPLDRWLDVRLPLELARLGVPPTLTIALLGAALLLVTLAAFARACAAAPEPLRRPLLAALALAGTLQAFAGYAEVWALALAVAAWWWTSLDRPFTRPRDALRAAALWLLLFLSHRLALVMLVPQAWRALGPPLAGDRPAARRLHLVLTLALAALALALGAHAGVPALGRDAGDLARSLFDPAAPRVTPPWDLFGLLALTMPLALLAVPVAGRHALVAAARSPRAALALAALVPLAPMLLVYPVAPHGMGAMRDWDLAALPGLIASLAAAGLVASAPPARARAALVFALPLLALQAVGWVAVNADVAAGERRALAIAEAPFAPPAEQRNHALVFLGYRAAGQRDFARSARRFEAAAAVLPNPRHLLFASQAWAAAGDVAGARRCLAGALALGPLPPDVARTARDVESMVLEAERLSGSRAR
jgi:hypothetical protein